MKAIPGFPDYLADEHGNVYSTRFCRKLGDRLNDKKRRPRRLKPWIVPVGKGYYSVGLVDPAGHRVKAMVHDLILLTFVGPKPPGAQVRHGPKGSLNNSRSNLSYGSFMDNRRDMLRDGTQHRGEKIGTHKLSVSDIIAIRKLHSEKAMNRLTNAAIGSAFGICPQNVSKIVYDSWRHVR